MELAASQSVSKRSRSSGFSDQQIQRVADGGAVQIAEWVLRIAEERGVRVCRQPNKSFINAASRLSDGVVDLDPVEELLVALAKAGVLSVFLEWYCSFATCKRHLKRVG